MQKRATPPGGDRHDYMSVAPYFWPDPKKPDGLPYLRKDGMVNPESRNDDYDQGRLGRMANAVETLALAYYFTGRPAYAGHAAKMLRTWFLDPATRMNPHLNFAQAVPGVNTGRGAGVLEGRNLSAAADASGLLAGSAAWSPEDAAALQAWLAEYLNWLLTSRNGRDEAGARNNHGTYYDVQAVQLCLVLGLREQARGICLAAKAKRIAAQIQPDGSQPEELTRTASLGYSRFNLQALFALATLAGHTGVDLWQERLPGGGPALQAALDYVLPYVEDPSRRWPHEQIKNVGLADFTTLLRQAAVSYRDDRYERVLAGVPGSASRRVQLVEPRPCRSIDVAGLDRARILRAADAALQAEPFTITRTRSPLSSGGANEYFSMADYWWPDPQKPDGLPYVQRDGESNPANFNDHRMALRRLRDAVAALAAAYRITGEERYAKKAAGLLQTFFLAEPTRMKPHLEYAQAILGRYAGRSYGIIDTLHLAEVPMAIMALEQSPSFTPDLVAGLRKWFADYAQWMLNSRNGQEEAKAKNNHSVAFWVQIACFAKFTGDEAQLAECRRQFKEVFVPNQMAADGSFPLELKRTKPYAYSIFQLDNMTMLCQVLSTPQDDLWKFELPDGRGIRRAVAYLHPFLADKAKWPLKPDVMAWAGWPARAPSLLFAGLIFEEPQYLALWSELEPDPANEEVRRNIAITQPLLWVR